MSELERSPQQGAEPGLLRIDAKLSHSELFREECKELILQVTSATKRMQDNDSNQLKQRARDIQFVKQELELKLEEITVEIDTLVALQARVLKALEATTEPLRVTELCLEERMKRFPSEMRHDVVDAELTKEKEVFEGVASLLQRVAEQIKEQIRLNRSSKYHLEHDLKDKFETETIDDSCAIMTVHSRDHLRLQNAALSPPSVPVILEQCENISDSNMAKAEQQRSNSVSLRALVESVLEQTAADMQKKIQDTSAAFQINIQEIKSAKSQMEDRIPKVQAEISGQQTIRQDLLAAVSETERSLSLAQARLALRQRRPGKEHCQDAVQTQLLSGVQQLTAHISRLREEVLRSEEEQRMLMKFQVQLQEKINQKSSSLYIDEVLCSQHREPVVIHKF